MISPILPPEARYVTIHAGRWIVSLNMLDRTFKVARKVTRAVVAPRDRLTVQVGRDASGEKTARCYSERAAEIDHAGNGAAVEDVEAVLSHY